METREGLAAAKNIARISMETTNEIGTESCNLQVFYEIGPWRALCAPGHLMGADPDKTRLSQWCALRRRGRVWARFLATVFGADYIIRRLNIFLIFL
jgi:hypothetical protein